MENTINKDKFTNSIFGSFHLGGSEFAITVSHVQEVVNAPLSYTQLPLSPPYMKGLFNLRGTVIPVIDLSVLLQISRLETSDEQKVAIIQYEGNCIGLLFDSTGEVFRSNDNEKSQFDSGEVISGVFKKNNGQRIIQILESQKLFNLKKVPKDQSKFKMNHDFASIGRGHRKQCISFNVGPAKCALPISSIQEILKIETLSEVALKSGYCIGSIDLRGLTVPVIDFTGLLQYREILKSEQINNGDRRVIVMKLDNELFGLLVDSIESIVSYFIDELLQFPVVEQQRGDMFIGCLNKNDESIILLDHHKILENEEVIDITRGHSQIFQINTSHKTTKKLNGSSRKSYISFKIENTYAIPIKDIREIIDYPKSFIQPPFLKDHVHGVLNLRGDLVTIIDARNLYSKQNYVHDKLQQKILIFRKNNIHFGLVVDSVESIVSLSDSEKIEIPKFIYEKSELSMMNDIAEAVEVSDPTANVKVCLLILNGESVVKRAETSLSA